MSNRLGLGHTLVGLGRSCGMPMSVIRSGGYSHSLPDLCVVLTPKQLGDLILNVRSSQEARKP